MSQKAEILFDAITGIREDLVEEAQRHVFCRRARWRRYGGLAACLVLAALAGFYTLALFGGGMGGSGAPSGDTNDAAMPPASAAPADTPELDSASAPEYAGEALPFLARVLAVSEDWVLAVPLPGEAFSARGPIRVRTEEVPELPELHPGDLIRISYLGELQDSYPPGLRATGVEQVSSPAT